MIFINSEEQIHMKLETCLAYIQNLDLNYLALRLIHKENWDEGEAREAVRKYKNFLKLRVMNKELIGVPTYEIDEVWHAHILHTKQYMEDCQKIFGSYMHHTPASPTGEDSEEMNKHYQNTAQLYENTFEESYMNRIDVSLW